MDNSNDFISNVNKIADKLNEIVTVNNLFNKNSLAALEELKNLNITLIVEDFKKGNYLGNRKIDIDLTLNNTSTTSVPTYQRALIVLVDGTQLDMPFSNGAGGILELSSHADIKNFIVNHTLYSQVVDTEVVTIEAFDETPAMIRFRDADGKASNIERIELFVFSGSVIESKVVYFWAKTTSALETLANRVGDILKIANDIESLVKLSSKGEELVELQNKIPELITNANSIYTKLSEILDSREKAELAISTVDNFTNIIVPAAINEYNQNHTVKLNTYNDNNTVKTTEYNQNHTAKVDAYNTNNTQKLLIIDAKVLTASQKADEAANSAGTATTKASEANTLVNNFITVTAPEKINLYNTNATTKITEYNTNHTSKLDTYNTNHTAKLSIIDDKVTTATNKASEANISANNASTSATNAANSAGTATTKASEAATSATNAANSAGTATTKASEAATSATNAATKASEAATSAANAEISKNTAGTKASEAASSALIATNKALEATQKANQIQNLQVQTSTLVAGSSATASYNPATGILNLGLTKGDKGDKGDNFDVNAVGLSSQKSNYNNQPQGFSFLATDTSLIYFKNSATSGDWSSGAPFGKGDKGDTGDAGSQWRTGSGVPANTLGKDNDLYIDSATGYIYQRLSGIYQFIAKTALLNDTANDLINTWSSSKIKSELDSKQASDADLTAIAGLGTNGLIVRTGNGTAKTITLAAASSKINITYGDGLNGNPTFDISESNLTLNNIGGTLSVSKGGTGATTLTGLLKGNGTGAFTPAVAGTDYVIPSGNITGNAGTATKLATVKSIAMTGDITWTVNFDGSANATGIGTLKNSGVVAGTYTKVTVDAKGIVTAAENPTLTKNDVGLTNVDNTADSAKPVSTAQSAALALKVNIADIIDNLTSFDTSKPLAANQGRVLKGLIDNINTIIMSDDTTLDAMQEVVNFIKQNKTDLQNLDLSNIAETTTLKHFTSILLDKLNGIAENANNYSHPSTHDASMINESSTKRFVSDTEKASWNGKLDKSGGVMTGAITAIRETKIAMVANDIDLATGNLFTKTISTATTFTVSNILASGNANSFILELTNAGSAVITWWSGVKWAGGTAPTLTSAGVDILGFYSHDGGTTWRGVLMSKDSK